MAHRPAVLGPAVLGVILAIVAVLAFAPAVAAPFDFDDFPAIVNNPTIRSAWPPSALIHTPPLGTPASGRPVANYSFALNYAANRALGISQTLIAPSPRAPVGYHVVNVALHLGTALLLYLFLSAALRLDGVTPLIRQRATLVAMATTAIWLVHPLQTEAVDYISQRTELLVSACYLTTLWAALRSRLAEHDSRGRAGRWAVLAVASSAIGMASKEVMITAPVAVLLFDVAFFKLWWRSFGEQTSSLRRALYAGLFVSAGICIALVVTGGRSTSAGFGGPIPWYRYLYSQAWAVAHYLRLAIWPTGLTLDYGTTPVAGTAGIPGPVLLVAFAAGVIVAWIKSTTRWLAFFGTWFFLVLAPSSSIVPIYTEIAAERRIYLALAPVILVIVVAVVALARRMQRLPWMNRLPRAAPAALLALLVAAFATITFQRSALYAEPVALWRDTIHKRPRNVRAYDNLAAAYMRTDPPDLRAADSVLRIALAVDSAYTPSLVRAASIAIEHNDLAAARGLLERALRTSPDDEAATARYSKVLIAQGDPEKAIPLLQRVVRADPGADAYVDLGSAYLTSGRVDSAVAPLVRAIALDSSRVDAMRYLGGALVEQNRGAEALPYLERVAADSSAAAFDVAVESLALAQAGRFADASQLAARAVSMRGADVGTAVFAGRAMLVSRHLPEADMYLTAALRAAPNDPRPMTWLGITKAQRGDREEALRLLRRVVSVAPNDEAARSALAQLEGAPKPAR
ncbi:MAG TPA: tetratricopeptide repeat protein [Gemmatimonadaceae bacterium]|nr:tetratricopeptide repeat protein [Gemmatimonadaceae bacterium]